MKRSLFVCVGFAFFTSAGTRVFSVWLTAHNWLDELRRIVDTIDPDHVTAGDAVESWSCNFRRPSRALRVAGGSARG